MGSSSRITRRHFVATSLSFAAAWELRRTAFALGFAQGVPVCNAAAEQEVGPYYVADELLRSNIREDKPGLPLTLRLLVLDARTCRPLPRAAVDLWHCDALGLYAGFTKVDPTGFGMGGPPPGFDPQHPERGPGGPPPGFDPQHPGNRPGPPEGLGPPPAMKTTDQLTFLRGIQFTDGDGRVQFDTIFPSFYMGRTNHIHFKVREGGHVAGRPAALGGEGKTYLAGHTSHTGQVFFPEAVTAELMNHGPYAGHKIHRTTQAEDQIFQDQHGAASLATLQPQRGNDTVAGYTAELVVAVDPSATPRPVERGGPGSRRDGPPRPPGAPA